MKFDSQASTMSKQRNIAIDIGSIFWQQWQEHRDCLYRCCVKWMGGNPIDAEDALSRAMLKAWEKVQKYAGEIANFKAWMLTLTHNLCVDIHQERSRGANRDRIPQYDSPLHLACKGRKPIKQTVPQIQQIGNVW